MRSDSIRTPSGASGSFARRYKSVSTDLEEIFEAREGLVRREVGAEPKCLTSLQPHSRRRWPVLSCVLGASFVLLAFGGAMAFYAANDQLPAVQLTLPRAVMEPPPPERQIAVPVEPSPVPALAPPSVDLPPVKASPATPPPPRAQAVVRPRATTPPQTAVSAYQGNPECIGLDRRERARCMRPRVLAADQLMRGSYAQAVRAGMSSRTLASYQRRWTRVLRQTDSDPHHVTSVLSRMARELDDERFRRGAGT